MIGSFVLACTGSHGPTDDAGATWRPESGVCSDVDFDIPAESCTIDGGEIRAANLPEATEVLRGCGLFHGSINLQDSAILDVSFAESVVVVDGRINLFRNRYMVSLRGLESVQSVDSLYIRHAFSLESVRHLSSLRVVHGAFYLDTGDALQTIEGLERLTCVGELTLWLPSGVTSIEPLSSLQRVEGDVDVAAPGIATDELRAWVESVDVAGGIVLNGEIVREAS